MMFIVLCNKAANMLLPQHDNEGNQDTVMASLKSLSFPPQSANLFFVDSHTTNTHTHTQIVYWICITGRQGSRDTSVRYPSTWEQGGVDIQLPQWEHHGDSYKLSLSLHPRKRPSSHTEQECETALQPFWNYCGRYTTQRWPTNIYKVEEPPPKSGCQKGDIKPVPYRGPTIVECRMNLTVIRSCLFHSREMVHNVICQLKCSNWAENNRRHRAKLGRPGFAHPSPGVS